MTLPQYISSIASRYQLGNATEHTFRGDLQNLLEALVPSIRAGATGRNCATFSGDTVPLFPVAIVPL